MVKTATVTLSDTTSPHSVDYQGFTDNFETVHFRVPAGVDRLNGAIAFQGSSIGVDRPGAAGPGRPAGPPGRLLGAAGGRQLRGRPGGRPDARQVDRLHLEPGQRGRRHHRPGDLRGQRGVLPELRDAVHADADHPGRGYPDRSPCRPARRAPPGDVAASIVAAIPGQPAITVPVTLRALAPTGTTSFSGVLTGGNGGASYTGEAEYYQFDLPAGEPALERLGHAGRQSRTTPPTPGWSIRPGRRRPSRATP